MLQDIIRTEEDIPPPVPIRTPEWPSVDGDIFVRRATPQDLADFWAWFSDSAKEGDAMAPYAVTWFACEADGKTPVFEHSAAVAKWLKDEKAGCVIARIFTEADKLNYLTEASREHFRKNWPTGDCEATSSSAWHADFQDAMNSTGE